MLCEVARRIRGKKNTFNGREVLGYPDLSLRRFWQQGVAVTKKAT
jgi:hypothetical protein